MKGMRVMWNRCTSAALRVPLSGCTRRAPSSSTCGPTWHLQPPPTSPCASNRPVNQAARTSTWSAWVNSAYCSAKPSKPRAKCTALASMRGRCSSRQCLRETSVEGSRASSTSWSTTGLAPTRNH